MKFSRRERKEKNAAFAENGSNLLCALCENLCALCVNF